MSTFYVLPPRSQLGEHLASFLRPFLPGLDWDTIQRASLAGLVADAALARRDVFVVFREELPEGEPLARTLADGFGAETGDEVVEVRCGLHAGEVHTRRWRLAG